MKVIVQVNLEGRLKESVSSHIRSNWPEATIAEETSSPQKYAGRPAVLIVTSKAPVATQDATSLKEVILVRNESSVEEILFEVGAKLGRLTKSDLAEMKREISGKSAVTRREFLFGLAGRSQSTSDVPVVLNDSCESKFGCSKCVDACPAPDALSIQNETVLVSSEYCVRCGLCAGVCPVAAIQTPTFSEDAYRGLLTAIHKSSAPKKTLVVTCDESSVAPQSWMDVEEIPGIGLVGLRQTALAADSSLGAFVVYCPDGLCVGKERARRAVGLITSVARQDGPVLAYLEGKEGLLRLEEIQRSSPVHSRSSGPIESPWKNYVNALKSISSEQAEAAGLGLTDMEVADSCTLCNACVEGCPHEALAIQEGELAFQPEECTGCGYCEKICPERAITLSEMIEPLNLSKRTVCRDEMVLCTKCSAPFASARMLKRISQTVPQNGATLRLCPNCRQTMIYDELFSKFNVR